MLNSRDENLMTRLTVSENRVLMLVFEPQKDEVTGGWRYLHKKELNNLYCSLDIIRVITSRRMRWVGHAACMG
jgi:hypothetical protein